MVIISSERVWENDLLPGDTKPIPEPTFSTPTVKYGAIPLNTSSQELLESSWKCVGQLYICFQQLSCLMMPNGDIELGQTLLR